ncbi:Vacuolar protein-sorting-associated protein 36 [Rhizina undulata]
MLSRIDFTPASRPVFLPDETLLFVQNAVGLYDGKFKIPNYQNGCAYLTSHRACYVDNEEPRKYSVAVELKDVDRVEFYAGFLKSSPKITLHLKSYPPSSSPGQSTTASPHISTPLTRPSSPALQAGPWICPICSFSNPFPSNYTPTVTPASSIPPCLSCGIRPPPQLLEKSFLPQNIPNTSLPTLSLTSDPASGTEATFACPRCTFLNHPSLLTCEICSERLLSPNLTPSQLSTIRADSPAPTSRIAGLPESPDSIKFSFRASGEKIFHERLKSAMLQRKWLLASAPPVPKPSTQSSPLAKERLVGIAGLERQGLEARKQNTLAISDAFYDLEALMGRAKEMIALAENFSTRLVSTQTFANSEESALLRSSTQALGLVSKDMVAGNDKSQELYITELARQVADFLADDRRGVLKREGGVMTLVDLWAVYNRARGIDLISPADLEKAARLFEKLKLPVRLREFRSGLLVVQDVRATDAETVRRILEWVRCLQGETGEGGFGKGVTASETAERFQWSVGVATEELEMAEERGALCREVGIEGVRFWDNWFAKMGEEEIAGNTEA